MEEADKGISWAERIARLLGISEESKPEDEKITTQMFTNSGQGGDWRGVVPAMPEKEDSSTASTPVSETKKV